MKERRSEARTHYIHKISYSIQERIVGLFVIIAVGILLWLLLSTGKKTTVFEDAITIYGQLESAQGISEETEIKISGLSAGTITSIDVRENQNVVVTMAISKKYNSLLRTDSVGKLTNPGIAVLGGSVINITAGSKKKPILEDGDTIVIEQVTDIKETLNKVTETFKQLQSSIERINDILGKLKPETVGNTFENIDAITTDIRKMSNQINKGEGMIGSLVYDRKMEGDIEKTVENLLDMTHSMKEVVTILSKEIENVPELMDKVGPLLNQANKTIEATQRIWPLSSAMEKQADEKVLTSPAPAND